MEKVINCLSAAAVCLRFSGAGRSFRGILTRPVAATVALLSWVFVVAPAVLLGALGAFRSASGITWCSRCVRSAS